MGLQLSNLPAQPPGQTLLVLEVLGGWTGRAEWRLGDTWSQGNVMYPYAVVTYGSQTDNTGVEEMAVGSPEDGEDKGNFDTRMVFSLDEDNDDERDGHQVKIALYDQRTIQAFIRGNPSIGETSFKLQLEAAGQGLVQERLQITRNGVEGVCASVLVQYTVMRREVAGRVLLSSAAHDLRRVLCELANVLKVSDGIDRLLATRPGPDGKSRFDSPVSSAGARQSSTRSSTTRLSAPRLNSPRGNSPRESAIQAVVSTIASSAKNLIYSDPEAEIRKHLEELSAGLIIAADKLENETDDEVRILLAALSRQLLVFVTSMIEKETNNEGDTRPHPVDFATRWIKDFFTHSVNLDVDPDEVSETMPQINESRLRRVLMHAEVTDECLVPVDDIGVPITRFLQVWRDGSRAPNHDRRFMGPPASLLGKGAHGFVWRAKDKCTNRWYAVKDMDTKSLVSQRECDLARYLVDLAHPCVINIFAVLDYKKYSCRSLIMEYCPGGDLNEHVKAARNKDVKSYAPPPNAMHLIAQVFLGLEHLHLTPPGMLVRDVKPENVVVSGDGRRAKITDFGMSRSGKISDGKFSFNPHAPPGTPHYVAPEVVKGRGYDYNADFYSWAVTVWVILTGGLVSLAGRSAAPRPPCLPRHEWEGRKIGALGRNWELLEKAVNSPQANDARPLPTKEAAEMVLLLTKGGENRQKFTHQEIRALAFWADLKLPEYGKESVEDWLDFHDSQDKSATENDAYLLSFG